MILVMCPLVTQQHAKNRRKKVRKRVACTSPQYTSPEHCAITPEMGQKAVPMSADIFFACKLILRNFCTVCAQCVQFLVSYGSNRRLIHSSSVMTCFIICMLDNPGRLMPNIWYNKKCLILCKRLMELGCCNVPYRQVQILLQSKPVQRARICTMHNTTFNYPHHKHRFIDRASGHATASCL